MKVKSSSKLRDVISEPTAIKSETQITDITDITAREFDTDDEQEIPEEEIKAILEGRQIKPFETPIEIDDDDLIIFPAS